MVKCRRHRQSLASVMMPTWPRRCALALLLAPAVVLGQGGEGGPTFRSGVQSIDVDVLVTDKSGKAVRGLTKEDFILSEDDAPQQITTFTFVVSPSSLPPRGRQPSPQ